MATLLELEAARRAFLDSPDGDGADGDGERTVDAAVRPAVSASWGRCRRAGMHPDRVAAAFRGPTTAGGPLRGCAESVFDQFVASNPTARVSLLALHADGVVGVRVDAHPPLGRLLDGLRVAPGYEFGEAAIGTTAAAIAVGDGVPVALCGPEHFATHLTCLAEAAAPVCDPGTGKVLGAVALVGHQGEESSLALPLAKVLAAQVRERLAGEPDRRVELVLRRLRERGQDGREPVLATDGDTVLTNAAARELAAPDLGVLNDLLLAGMTLDEHGHRHVDLPGAGCVDVELEPLWRAGELVGCVLACGVAPAGGPPAEATRRQGSHVAPIGPRDYAQDLRRDGTDHVRARIQANRDLLTPVLRARHELAASVRQGRHHLLIGEPGVGKRTLGLEQFRRAHPSGRVVELDCVTWNADTEEAGARLIPTTDGRATLVFLRGLGALGPVAARRLDEALRPLVALEHPPLVIGCVDTPAVDATRPYGLLLRHFHQMTRIPPLRYRVDEVGDIAWSILRRLSDRRSLRLSLQVIRVLEGYAWPGNISELEDVLRYVVARKPLGEVQPPDLPAVCFQGHARRMSMLETAQCDAIIQALYESNGNRYRAAAMLGIARSSLYRKIDAFGISYIA